MDESKAALLNGAVAQAANLKEKVKELRCGMASMGEDERFLRICSALDDVTDITIKLNTALRNLC